MTPKNINGLWQNLESVRFEELVFAEGEEDLDSTAEILCAALLLFVTSLWWT